MRRGTLATLVVASLALTACRSYVGEPLDPSAANVVPHVITANAATISTAVPDGFMAPGVEGAVLFLRLTDATFTVILDRPFAWNKDSQLVPPGDYRLDVYMRVCDGNCGHLDQEGPPFCTTDVVLTARSTLVVDIGGSSLAPGLTCTIRSP